MLSAHRLTWLVVLATGLLASSFSVRIAVTENHHIDLFIYTSGAKLALQGESPYQTAIIHQRIHEQFPEHEFVQGNGGYFLPPASLLVWLPLALLPWLACKIVASVVMASLATATGWGLWYLGSGPRSSSAWLLVIPIVALNQLTLFSLILGQTTVFVMSFIVFGELCWRGGWRRLGAILWALAFLKPHLALVLLPLAWSLDGWRRSLEVLLWAGVLNLLAGMLFFGKPLFAFDYLRYLQEAHQSVEFNRVSFNKQMTSWNRLLYALGGPAIELGIPWTLAGYGLISVLVGVRGGLLRAGANSGSRAWLFASAGAAMMACCQVQPYELPLLLLALPYVGQRLQDRSAVSRFGGMVLAGLLLFSWANYNEIVAIFNQVATVLPIQGVGSIFESHRSLGIGLIVLTLLLAGPVRPQPHPSPDSQI